MSCPQASAILRLVSGECSLDAEPELREHLETCSVCRSVLEDARVSWDALGGWELDVSGVDLTRRILSEVETSPRHGTGAGVPAVRRLAVLRVAASIALAIGLGIGAGHLVPSVQSQTSPQVLAALEGMEEALVLIGLTGESATGLSVGLEPGDMPTGGNAR